MVGERVGGACEWWVSGWEGHVNGGWVGEACEWWVGGWEEHVNGGWVGGRGM